MRNIRSVYVDPEKNNWRRKHDGSRKALTGRSDRRLKENRVSLQFQYCNVIYIIPFDTRSLGSRKEAKK